MLVVAGACVLVVGLYSLLQSAQRRKDEQIAQQAANERIETAKLQAARLLKDPDSAKFRDVRLVQRGPLRVVCGLINGRNGFGAYSGEMRFVQDGQAAYLLDGIEFVAPQGARLWDDFCK